LQQSIEARQREWAGTCYCDYGFHLLLHGKLSQGVLGALPEAIQSGHASVKMFTTDIRPNRLGRMVQFGDIWEVLKLLAQAGGIAAIHAEDNDIVMHMYEKLIREDRTGFENLAEVHNTLSEDLSFNRVIRLAENVEGAALYMVHVSAATGAAAIAGSRARGFPIYGETLHQYLLYGQADYRRPNGQIYHTYPSLKFPEDQAALWRGTRDGALQCIATVVCDVRAEAQQVKLQQDDLLVRRVVFGHQYQTTLLQGFLSRRHTESCRIMPSIIERRFQWRSTGSRRYSGEEGLTPEDIAIHHDYL